MNRKYLSMLIRQSLLICTFLMAGFFAVVSAHEGQSHDKELKPQNNLATAPTLTAVSENYELVAIVQARQMTVYLDQFVSNTPVVDADLDFDFSGTVVKATRNLDGTYSVALPKKVDLKSSIPVTVTILTATGADLLSGDLVIPKSEAHKSWFTFWVVGIVAACLITLLLIWLAYKRNPALLIQIKQKLPASLRRFIK
jgi:hypothetical protein